MTSLATHLANQIAAHIRAKRLAPAPATGWPAPWAEDVERPGLILDGRNAKAANSLRAHLAVAGALTTAPQPRDTPPIANPHAQLAQITLADDK